MSGSDRRLAMAAPSKVERLIDPAHLKRAKGVDSQLVGPYMEQIAEELVRAVDYWRRYGAPPENVDLALDAFVAMWTEAGVRGLR